MMTVHMLFAAVVLTVSSAFDEPREISWADLVPDGQVALPPPPDDPMLHTAIWEQSDDAETVPAIHDQFIRMPGFVLPLDYTERGKVSSFLLVPYFGACIHVPPPPPNQIVFVETDGEPVNSRPIWSPVWVTGKITAEMNFNGLGNAAYTLNLETIEAF